MDKLSEKQKRFIDYYIETGNAADASRKAGYKAKTDRAMASVGYENLIKLDRFIQEKLKQKENSRIASQDEVLEYLTKVMRGEEKDAFGLDASLQDRTKCAELLGKRYGSFREKLDVAGNIPVVVQDDITE